MSTITQQILNGAFNSPEFKGFIEKPTLPNEAIQIFGKIQGEFLSPIEPDLTRKYGVIKSVKQTAGLTARGATEFSTSGEQEIEQIEAGICKIGSQMNYTQEDEAKIKQLVDRAKLNSSEISNYQIFQKYIDRKFNPIVLLENINNTINLQGFFGENFAEKIHRKEQNATLDYSGSVYGVFNHNNVNVVQVNNNGTGSTDVERRKWKNKTLDQIKDDLHKIYSSINNSIYQSPDTLVLSFNMYEYLRLKKEVQNTLYPSYLEEIQRVFTGVNIIFSRQMNDFKKLDGTNAVDDLGDRFVFFKKDPMYYGLIFSDIYRYPIEMKTGNTSIKVIATSGGFYSKLKEGFYIATGIN
jgi:hypothetical protein